ncbi:MAG: trigger factor family protein, partial [Anaerolineaceae bacterium]|nr:trigger factor family protein [Anaerolineaceae bacterium]
MKIETVARDDQQTRLVAELDVETLEKYKRQAARKVSQTTKIPGFRPGKAPYDLVRRMLGDERLTQEAVELLLDEVYPKVLTEANINPSGPGKLEEIVSMDPPTFAFIVPLPPEVQIEDYKSLRKEY